MQPIYNAQSLEIKYLGATNTKGSRISVHSTHLKKTKILSWHYDMSGMENMVAAEFPPEMPWQYTEIKNGFLMICTDKNVENWKTIKAFFGIKE